MNVSLYVIHSSIPRELPASVLGKLFSWLASTQVTVTGSEASGNMYHLPDTKPQVLYFSPH